MPLRLLLAALLLVTMAACSGPAVIKPGPVYPGGLPRAETLDVQVIRRGTSIELTNTSARQFGPSTVWLNERFGREIDGLAVGQTLRLPLGEFEDEFSQAFRAGGFFATRKPDRLALVELATGDAVFGLVTIGRRNP